ncbi:anhydro-N-acetylmuramic acid kinase [Streptomyces yangpuensis]|uniref:Anhydro-N-acetylmuramic acid kinase n=1 Tax=Streptomyces yangpuensis TaxID=1648182 RepID=A0ABY5Q5E8_9ACTN|nr:anhydro-N-acetylmuramic acid kinase [Streptomyces yangpuensis]MBZ9600113.1 anhydro-N-acetylmuramic acid kinase [Streptomyces erythrochromogenes]UUY51666.1 anhydro-N-acetylmuramic acid kinase [Streptomyces yangpuensis]
MRVIGLMSGTSYDAVDAAACDLGHRPGDGALHLTPLGMVSEPYPADLRTALAGALPPAATTLADVCRLDTRIGQAFGRLAVRADRELCSGRAELIASHGQTVYHWAADGQVHGTLQLGEPAWIAEATGRPVVSGFRPRDVAAGGQGAPLVSLIDLMLLRGRPGVPAALNIGGIANVTVVPGNADPLAFDTGPGNALIDAAVRELSGGRLAFDEDGALAASGRVHEDLLRRLLAEPYYRLPPPRTTGKELFHQGYLRSHLAEFGQLPPQDLLATLTRLTARTVADALRPLGATEVFASGGGVRNPTLTRMLRAELAGTRLRTSEELGLPAAAKEAYAFAVLGYLTLHGLPGNAPGCTGAAGPRVLGSITPGRRRLRLPEPPPAAPYALCVRTDGVNVRTDALR